VGCPLLHAKDAGFPTGKICRRRGVTTSDLLSRKGGGIPQNSRLSSTPLPTTWVGICPGKLWQESSFDILHHYDELLQNEQSIKELADLLGNMREAEIEIEEEEFEKNHHSPGMGHGMSGVKLKLLAPAQATT
jgi:hypothetical protein